MNHQFLKRAVIWILAVFCVAALGGAAAEESGLESLQMTKAEMREIYDDLNALYNDPQSPAYADFEHYSPEAVDAYEKECIERIAEKYKISEEDVNTIFINGVLGRLADSDREYTVKFGELLDTKITGTTLVVKTKIKPSFNNRMTINQNYHNVCDLIEEQGGDEFSEIQYWAVADMADGSEAKVVSFTVDKPIIEAIKMKQIVAPQLGSYVLDLYIHPSLKN